MINESIEMVPIKDIPENIADELERLHHVLSLDESAELKTWAKEKIDNIHVLFFMARVTIKEEKCK